MMNGNRIFVKTARMVVAVGACVSVLGCELEQGANSQATQSQSAGIDLVERDVEAPQVFDTLETALWDGRPSLGGIWVASPNVTDPERVIIRNKKNDKFVIGALFRREREYAGPRLQLSSDAADALGILAGQPTQISVTALRRETVPTAPAVAKAADAKETLDKPAKVEAQELAAAAVAVATLPNAVPEAAKPGQKRPQARPAAPAKPAAKPAAAAKKPVKATKLAKPYIQLGIFGVEQNAKNTAQSMRQRGIIPMIKKLEMNEKPFWRVIVGPATSADELKTLIDKVKKAGFKDAYAVSG